MKKLVLISSVLLALPVDSVSTSALDSGIHRLFPKAKVMKSRAESVHMAKRQSSGMCPAGWTPYGDHCYVVSGFTTTWQSAMRGCRVLNACLVQIDNSEENSFIGRLVRASPVGSFVVPFNKTCEHFYDSFLDSVWIGLNDVQTEGRFGWSDCGWPRSQWAVWQNTEPNDYEGIEDCVEMFTMDNERGIDKWNDVYCGCSRAFVCEMASPTTTTMSTTKLSPTPSKTTRKTTVVAPTLPSTTPSSTTTTRTRITITTRTVRPAPSTAAVPPPPDDLSIASPGWEPLMTSPWRELFIAGLVVVGLGLIIAAVVIVRWRLRRRKPAVTTTVLELAASDSPHEAAVVAKVDDEDHLYTEIITYSDYSALRSSYTDMPHLYNSLRS